MNNRNKKEDIRIWQDKIADAFWSENDKVVGPRVGYLIKLEHEVASNTAGQVCGFNVIAEAFQDFAMHTFEDVQSSGRCDPVFRYSLLVACFQRLRYAVKGYYEGYYFGAAGVARSAWEIALYVGAELCQIVESEELLCFTKTDGFAKKPADEQRAIKRKHDRKLQDKIYSQMFGRESSLDKNVQLRISEFLMHLHSHVHGSESDFNEAYLHIAKNHSFYPIEPRFDMRRAAIFANTWLVIAWMLLRLFPAVFLSNELGEDWKQRYGVLDRGFAEYMELWATDMSASIQQFIHAKFTYSRHSSL